MICLFPSHTSLNQNINNRLLLFLSGGKDGGSFEPHRYSPSFCFSSVAFFFFLLPLTPAWAQLPHSHYSVIHGVLTLHLWLHAGNALTKHNRYFVCLFHPAHTVCLYICSLWIVDLQQLRCSLPHVFTAMLKMKHFYQFLMLKY